MEDNQYQQSDVEEVVPQTTNGVRCGYNKTFSIPRALLALPLSHTERMVISTIVSLSNKYIDNGGCNLSNAVLAKRHRCSKSAIAIAISKANKLGMVKSRSDDIIRTSAQDGSGIIQVRQLQMHIPEIWELFGEIWGEFHFTGCEESEALLNFIEAEVKSFFDKKEEVIDIKAILEKVMTEFSVDPPLKNQKTPFKKSKDPLYIFKRPPLKKYKTPFKNLYAFIFKKNNIFKKEEYLRNKFFRNISGEKSPDDDLEKSSGNFNLDGKETNLKETKPNQVQPIRKTNPSPKQKDSKYLPLATQLAAIIQSNKNIRITPKKIEGWTRPIRLLIENEQVGTLRVQHALDWYSVNIGQPYVPVIESGESLRNKFLKLEAAILRDPNNKSPIKLSPKNDFSDDAGFRKFKQENVVFNPRGGNGQKPGSDRL